LLKNLLVLILYKEVRFSYFSSKVERKKDLGRKRMRNITKEKKEKVGVTEIEKGKKRIL